MSRTLHKSLEKSLSALAELAADVQAFLTSCGVTEHVIFKVQLGLEETIRNLIEHTAAKSIQLRLDVGNDRVSILLDDDGLPFDPTTAAPFDPPETLEARAPHGMGLHLVRSMIDEVHYERLGSRNHLRMVVLFARASRSAVP
jgi:anti-sigma regulatory factor (Ser/Thr protein kinase)